MMQPASVKVVSSSVKVTTSTSNITAVKTRYKTFGSITRTWGSGPVLCQGHRVTVSKLIIIIKADRVRFVCSLL